MLSTNVNSCGFSNEICKHLQEDAQCTTMEDVLDLGCWGLKHLAGLNYQQMEEMIPIVNKETEEFSLKRGPLRINEYLARIGTVYYSKVFDELVTNYADYFETGVDELGLTEHKLVKEPSEELRKEIQTCIESDELERIRDKKVFVLRVAQRIYYSLSDEDKNHLIENPDYYDYHFGFGTGIRNKYIHGKRLLFFCPRPDSLSHEIFDKLIEIVKKGETISKSEGDITFTDIDSSTDYDTDYCFFSLISFESEIIEEPANGFFSLIAAARGEDNLVTYKPVVCHSGMYYGGAMSVVSPRLNKKDERLLPILKRRFGLDGEKKETLTEIGRDLQLTSQRISQLEEEGLRIVRRSTITSKACRMAKTLFYSDENSFKPITNHGEYLENIIRREYEYINLNKDADYEGFLSREIIMTHKIKRSLDSNSIDSIDKLGLGERSANCLKRAGITSITELMRLSDEEILRIRNLGRKSYEEIIRRKREVSESNTYDLDYDHVFLLDLIDEMPITKTGLPPRKMIDLIERGFYFVNDFTERYNCIEIEKNILTEDFEVIKSLLKYSEPMIRIKLPNNLRNYMRKNNVKSLQEVIDVKAELTQGVEASLEYVLNIIETARNEYCITQGEEAIRKPNNKGLIHMEVLPSVLEQSLISSDISISIWSKIQDHTNCDTVKDLWKLSSKELVCQCGLNKEELNELLDEMDRITAGIGGRYNRFVKNCRSDMASYSNYISTDE